MKKLLLLLLIVISALFLWKLTLFYSLVNRLSVIEHTSPNCGLSYKSENELDASLAINLSIEISPTPRRDFVYTIIGKYYVKWLARDEKYFLFCKLIKHREFADKKRLL